MKNLYCSLLLIFLSLNAFGQRSIVIGESDGGTGPYNIKVTSLDLNNNEPLVGVNILIDETQEGYASDVDGVIEMNLNKGSYTLFITYIGYKSIEYNVRVLNDGKFKVFMEDFSQQIEEIVVSSRASDYNVKNTEIGKQVLTVETIEGLPPFVGEVDILKSITLLPGVTTVGEASSGFNIRGSSADQNLILLGGAPLYNPSHLFGFFSAFNTDLIQDVSIYKGGIPAKYGGRAASILDLRFKSGDDNNWNGSASVGLISSKISAGGPIIKNKLSLLVGARSSYSNYLLNAVNDANISNSSAQFYDANVILDYQIGDRSNVRYSFYRSADNFAFASDTSFFWSNQNHVLAFNKAFGEKFFLDVDLVQAQYKFSIINNGPFNSFNLDSEILDRNANVGFRYIPFENQEFSFGANAKLLTLDPGNFYKKNEDSFIDPIKIENENGQEGAAYFQHDLEIGEWLGLSYGVRYSIFRLIGANSVANYDPLFARNEENIIGFTEYGQGDLIQEYSGWEPRASIRISLGKTASFKMGYNKMYQYIHLVSNTTTIAPTDIWKLSDNFVKPQEVDQYSVGLFKNFFDNKYESSVEAYYKDLRNILDYKDGADLILNPNIESALLSGNGTAYGLEFYLKKNTGDMTGWLSYTYSRSERQVIGSFPEEIINNGQLYPANYDKPHSFNAVMEYKFNSNVKASGIFTYSTGRPITYPEAKFIYGNSNIAFYETRNGFRVPDYHRLDLSLTFAMNGQKKIFKGDWVISVYNVYGRKNTFSVFFNDLIGEPPQAYRLSVLGIPFPSLSYNFSF